MLDNDPTGTTPSATSEVLSSGVSAASADPTGQPRNPDGTFGPNYVYGADDNVAEWKRFKTKEELNTLTDQMYNIMQQGQPAQSTVAQPAVPVAPEPAAGAVPDADMWLSDPTAASEAHFNTRIGQVQKEILAPQLAGIYTANAQTARALASQSNGEAYSRWGPEIDMQMSAIPVENRTFEMYTEAVKLVKGAHASEITQEALDKAVADEIERRTAAGTIRTGDAPTGAAGVESLDFNSESLGDRWGHLANIEPEARMDFLRKLHPDLSLVAAQKKYLDTIKKGNAVAAEANS